MRGLTEEPTSCCAARNSCRKLENVAPKTKERKRSDLVKTEDVEYHLRCASGAEAIYREEVWENEAGKVAKYNLAFIHFGVYQHDHGRVVGYDNAHGHHQRHFMGEAQVVEFVSYDTTLSRFQDEVRHYRETT